MRTSPTPTPKHQSKVLPSQFLLEPAKESVGTLACGVCVCACKYMPVHARREGCGGNYWIGASGGRHRERKTEEGPGPGGQSPGEQKAWRDLVGARGAHCAETVCMSLLLAEGNGHPK